MIRRRIAAVAVLTAIAGVSPAAGIQERPDPKAFIAAQKEKMKALTYMDGVWRGSAWTMLPSRGEGVFDHSLEALRRLNALGDRGPGLMCRYTLSVGWDGTLYDCDFNQMLDLKTGFGAPSHIRDFDPERLHGRGGLFVRRRDRVRRVAVIARS
jgi:hypothetical protein